MRFDGRRIANCRPGSDAPGPAVASLTANTVGRMAWRRRPRYGQVRRLTRGSNRTLPTRLISLATLFDPLPRRRVIMGGVDHVDG
jgi:hypothetical protein